MTIVSWDMNTSVNIRHMRCRARKLLLGRSDGGANEQI